MILTAEDVDLLKQLSTAGERGRTIGVLNSTELQHLVRAGYIADDSARHRITRRGKDALSDALRFS